MIQNGFSQVWAAWAPGLGNHLWQSTLFSAAVAALTLALRRHSAQARYWLWLAASLKFLIPFSFLTSIGSRLSFLQSPAPATTSLHFTAEVARPFASTAATHSSIISAAASSSLADLLPALLAAAWFCGFAAVLGVWLWRWRKTAAVLKAAVPLDAGREVRALRRMESAAGIGAVIDVRLSPAHLEPGIVGVVRPVLIWPQGISARLEDAQIETILAHELWHVRRRDNLTAAIHQVVTALFWFHPLVWWIGARLVDERERACDEQVLRLGSDREVYASSVLQACEFCVASPISFVSGITGADLKSRIVRIMTHGPADRLGLGRKLLLTACAAVAIAGPIGYGMLNAPRVGAQVETKSADMAYSFEVATVKPSNSNGMFFIDFGPGKFTMQGETLSEIIQFAYGLKSTKQLTPPSKWNGSQRYDIEAKADDATAAALRKLPEVEIENQMRLMLQALLADRFKLEVKQENKEIPVYALVVDKGGVKMKLNTTPLPTSVENPLPPGQAPEIRMRPGYFTGHLCPASKIVDILSEMGGLDRMVVDHTGLTGNYDFELKWTPDQIDPAFRRASEDSQGPGSPDTAGPSIFTALQEQLGLKLEPRKEPALVVTIEHVEAPTPN